MLQLYARAILESGRRLVGSWPALLVLPLYPLILYVGGMLTGSLGIVGQLLMSLVVAACWSSYLQIISEAVTSVRFRLSWDELKSTFGARFWDVVSVMFAFWMISIFTQPLLGGPRGPAFAAIIGLTIGFFFNAVPELLYQGNSRSFSLLLESGRFMTEHPLMWLLPNLLVAFLAFWLTGSINLSQPQALLVTFAYTFSSPMYVIGLLLNFPFWALPIVVILAHTFMIFRGVLFRELARGGANPRLQAFRSRTGS